MTTREDQGQRLIRYFTEGLAPLSTRLVGMEVETQFVQERERAAATLQQTQMLMQHLGGTQTLERGMISAVALPSGARISYELGRHNIEVATQPGERHAMVTSTRATLALIYAVAKQYGILSLFDPIPSAIDLGDKADLLAVSDDRDATWIQLDGRKALNLLASTSSVQFTVDVKPNEAIPMLNRLGDEIGKFLVKYPQDHRWRQYISTSLAKYDPCRYGGPLYFRNLEDYCQQLTRHAVVTPNGLVPNEEAGEYDISLFLRSVWWYFRLRRYGPNLCIEIRPLPRRSDDQFEQQLSMVLGSMGIY